MNQFIILIALAFGGPILLQQGKQAQTTEINGVVILHDKFRDRKTVATKPIDILLVSGKQSYICNAIFGYSVEPDKTVSPMWLLISPGGTGIRSAMAEGLAPKMGGVYLSPDSDVVILIEGQPHRLGKVSKDLRFHPSGELDRSVNVEIPAEVFQAIVKAPELEMAVGPLETKISKRMMNGIREKLTTLERQFQSDKP
jgi:hypothetical protein